MARFEVVLRYENGHEYIFARVRRENGAAAERDSMVATTVENMREHSVAGERVLQLPDQNDPNAVVVVHLVEDGTTVRKTVTYRPIVREDENDELEDALLASLMALA